jgi:hypothetical protein
MAKVELTISGILLAFAAGIFATIALAQRTQTRVAYWERPSWDDLYNQTAGGYVACPCGVILQTVEAVHEHWKEGDFDTWVEG